MIQKVLLTILLATSIFAKDAIFFMPRDADIAIKELLRTLEGAKKSVDIAMFSFTNRDISKKLKNIAKDGIKVRIIYDKKSNINDKYSTIGYLSKYKNIDTYTISGDVAKNGKYSGSMHIKIAIIDSRTVVFGSANWSKSAFSINHELLFINSDEEIVKKSIDYFDFMIKNSSQY